MCDFVLPLFRSSNLYVYMKLEVTLDFNFDGSIHDSFSFSFVFFSKRKLFGGLLMFMVMVGDFGYLFEEVLFRLFPS